MPSWVSIHEPPVTVPRRLHPKSVITSVSGTRHLWIRAVYLMASKMSSIESPTGSTKHAESCPSSLPAFMSVGLFGMKSCRAISS